MVTAVASLAVAATRAYFTSQASVLGNSVTSGTLIVGTGGDSVSAPFAVSGLAPGNTAWEQAGYFTVLNEGDLDMLFRIYVNPTLNQSNISDYLRVRLTLRPTEKKAPNGYTDYGPGNSVVYEGPLSGVIGQANAKDNAVAAYVDGWPLKKDYGAVYKVEVGMDWSAPNSVQGKEFKGNIVIDAVQSDNQTVNVYKDSRVVTGVQWN
ncbi:MAG: hypothetical protein ACOX6N_05470 [Patescibacteria group bacterium]|jgi:hypothetical protein